MVGETAPESAGINKLPLTAVSKIPDTWERKERDGLRLNFTINNRHLITHTLTSMSDEYFSSMEHREDIVALQNFAWGQSERCYNFVAGRLSPAIFFATGSIDELTQFFDQVEQSDEFGTICQQTEAYMQTVREQWERTYPLASQVMQQITGLEFNKDMTVMITHPSLSNGQYLGNDTIAWGHHEDWENYSTIYLWHEALHSYFDFDDTSHALIQLIADNELRTRLNPGTTSPPFEGHESLFPLMTRIEPHWRSYLIDAKKEGKGDIRSFQVKVQGLHEVKEQSAQHISKSGIE